MDTLDTAMVMKLAEDSGGKPRVLAVDDQRDALRLLQIRLQMAGLECFTCSDGPSALSFLAQHPVDVVILDVMMPQMDGYEVCRQIKANERTRDIPVLFLTAKNATEDRVRGLEAGGHDYLTKPVEQPELLARTRAALRVKHLQDQLKEQIRWQQEVNQLHQGMLGEHWQKTLGQLAASLAHEINNPLAAALGSVQLLAMEDNLGANVLNRLQVIDRSLQRAGKKLRSLLLIAQNSRHLQRVSLAELMEDLLTLVNFQIVMSKVSLVTEFDGACAWEGVPGELAQALLYILNNAIEAVHGQPSPAITVKVEGHESGPCIRIIDNGVGVSPEIRGRIFEPFFTTKVAPHHGAGLYLASQIVRAAGGAIELHTSVTPRATEFAVALPARAH